MTYTGTFGVHLLPHHPGWEGLATPDLIRIAEVAGDGGAECIWFATRFLARDVTTLMSMLSARLDVSLARSWPTRGDATRSSW